MTQSKRVFFYDAKARVLKKKITWYCSKYYILVCNKCNRLLSREVFFNIVCTQTHMHTKHITLSQFLLINITRLTLMILPQLHALVTVIFLSIFYPFPCQCSCMPCREFHRSTQLQVATLQLFNPKENWWLFEWKMGKKTQLLQVAHAGAIWSLITHEHS